MRSTEKKKNVRVQRPVSERVYEELKARVAAALAGMPADARWRFWDDVERYIMKGIMPSSGGFVSLRAMFLLLKPEIDKAKARSERARARAEMRRRMREEERAKAGAENHFEPGAGEASAALPSPAEAAAPAEDADVAAEAACDSRAADEAEPSLRNGSGRANIVAGSWLPT